MQSVHNVSLSAGARYKLLFQFLVENTPNLPTSIPIGVAVPNII